MDWHDLTSQLSEGAARRTEALRGFLQTAAHGPSDHENHAAVGTRIAHWKIDGVLGEGGMGVVYAVTRADGAFQQRAAMKIMRGADAEARNRFSVERERLAALEHRGISRIIDGGHTDDNLPFMVVELVEGQPIDDFVADEKLSRSKTIGLLAELLSAVGYAHERLILHRDIKPSNVLIDDRGNPRLIDFGVASLLDTEEERAGPLTIAYAAPELVTSAPLTVGADLFSTGMLAYELLTGQLPARDRSGGAVIEHDLLEDRDLAAILAKATAAEPSARYSSAAAFAADLDAYLSGRPVAAREGGRVYKARKFVRRNPVATALSAGLFLSLVGGLIATTIMAERANAARRQAEYALTKAEQNFRVQEAYGDALHRAFGGEGNTERMTTILLERAAEAYDLRAEDPRRAAEITFAVGRNFIERNDYVSAAQIMEPWLEEGFGDQRLLVDGKLFLGLSFSYLNRYEEAAEFLREARSFYEQSNDYGSYEHILSVHMLSESVDDPAPLRDELRQLAQAALSADPSVEDRIYYLNVLSRLRSRVGDFAGAAPFTDEIIETLRRYPLVEIAGRDNLHVQKAGFDIFLHNDLASAQEELDFVQSELFGAKGRSQNDAYLYMYRSEISYRRGDVDQSVSDLKEGLEIARQTGGAETPVYINVAAWLVYTLARAGQVDEAQALYQDIDPVVQSVYGGRNRMHVLAAARLAYERDGVEAASAVLQNIGMSRAVAQSGLLPTSVLDELVDLGVEPAPTPE